MMCSFVYTKGVYGIIFRVTHNKSGILLLDFEGDIVLGMAALKVIFECRGSWDVSSVKKHTAAQVCIGFGSTRRMASFEGSFWARLSGSPSPSACSRRRPRNSCCTTGLQRSELDPDCDMLPVGPSRSNDSCVGRVSRRR